MKIQYFVASMAVAAVLVAPTAYSAPGGGTQVTHFLSRSAYVAGSSYVGNIYNYFFAQVYDDLNGVAQGNVYSESYDLNTNTYSVINCWGPAYAQAVSVKGNGSSTVYATLDPAAVQDCYSYNVGGLITIKAVGQANGYYTDSSSGIGTSTYGGTTYKYNNKYNNWSQIFSADTDNGFHFGTSFTGNASTSLISA